MIDIQQVQPGDLITASFFNQLIEELAALETRLMKVEGMATSSSVGVVITGVDKAVVHVGESIAITGQSFGFSVGAAKVRFDGLAPASFGASNDTKLVCTVPAMPGLPPGGTQVTLSVTNLTLVGPGATATRQITVLPAVVPQQGNLDIVLEDVSPDPLTANAPNEFRFAVQSDALLPTTATFAPKVLVNGQPVGWATTVLDANKVALAENRASLQPNETKTVIVRVVIPQNTNGQVFTLVMEASAPGLPIASAGLAPMTVGVNADPDPTFTMAPNASPALVGSTITSSVAAQFTEISVDLLFHKIGKYEVTLLPLAGTTGWAAGIVIPAPPQGGGKPAIDIVAKNLEGDGEEKRTIQFRVHPTTGASDPGQLRLTVKSTTETRERSLTFDLDRVP
jgi:hypothetical protein